MAYVASTDSCAMGLLTGVYNRTSKREMERAISAENYPITLAITLPNERRAEQKLISMGFKKARTGVYNPNTGRKVNLWIRVNKYKEGTRVHYGHGYEGNRVF